MDKFCLDAYKPKEIAARIETVCVSKSTTDPMRIFVLALLAGAFIALGALFYTATVHDSVGMNPGLLRLVGGLVFSLGLILVILAGAELFTGNNLLVIACIDRRITLTQLLKNWLIVYIGNFVGALGVLLLVYLSNHWLGNGGLIGAKALMIANAKVNLTPMEAFSRGILCNILVCLAVWLCFAGHTVMDKIAAIIFPITAFVALGFEHSVANMYFIPAGMLLQHQGDVVAVAQGLAPGLDLSNLDLQGLLLNNLLPVTLGNIVGGSVFVGIVYWFIYVRK
ncbi:MAG: formate/nitrite transporter family protein [Candidatus Polarisedimenticolaceae bacterium]|nr:formate/nitrite transporter family protein [Candidatus Polarisedimenticolaceae bacterium]